MKRGFYTIMSAQFFSSLADNALFVAAVELLKAGGAPLARRRAPLPARLIGQVQAREGGPVRRAIRREGRAIRREIRQGM